MERELGQEQRRSCHHLCSKRNVGKSISVLYRTLRQDNSSWRNDKGCSYKSIEGLFDKRSFSYNIRRNEIQSLCPSMGWFKHIQNGKSRYTVKFDNRVYRTG